MIEFKLPDIGEGLSEAELLEWTVAVGAKVTEGDEVAVISTDKVNVELTAPASGRVAELFGEPGDVIEVGTLIMKIEADGSGPAEDSAAGSAAAAAAPGETAGRATPAPATPGRPTAVKPVRAAPVVRRFAAEHGIDLGDVAGSGPGGQVLQADVEAHLSGTASADTGGGRVLKLTGGRLAAAKNLAQADRTTVSTTIQFDVHADAIQARATAEAGLTPTAVIAHCLVEVLGKHPAFNAVIAEDENELRLSDAVHLGIAVNTHDGLVVPVLRGADGMSRAEMAAGIAVLADRARDGALAREDFLGGTFTLSSTGSLEKAVITGTTPILNWPNVAILWVSRITDRPRVVDGSLEAGPVMSCSLTFDHRYLHGADGMAFINDFVQRCGSVE